VHLIAAKCSRIPSAAFGPDHQRGVATLIVALLLLGIISAMTLFSLSYGMQDRRAIDDEMAARLAQEAAQTGLDQGLQFFRAHLREAATDWLSPSGPKQQWERCMATDLTMPCGAVAAAVRTNYLRHAGALDMRDVFVDAAGAATQQLIVKMGDYDVRYDIYALLCLVDTQHPQQQCLDAAPDHIGPYAITLISYGTVASGDKAAKSVERHSIARETIAPHGASSHSAGIALAVVPGSWSDSDRVDANRNYVEN